MCDCEHTEKFLTLGQVAEVLAVSPSYVHKLCGIRRLLSVRLPVFKKDGTEADRQMLRVRQSDLQKFLDSLRG